MNELLDYNVKHCPKCNTEVKVDFLPQNIMVDPCPPPRLSPFTTVRCPKCGKKVLFWTGFRQVVK